MNKLIRSIRLLLFVLLIILASVGVGLNGGIPIPFTSKKKDPTQIQDEEEIQEGTVSESKQVFRN